MRRLSLVLLAATLLATPAAAREHRALMMARVSLERLDVKSAAGAAEAMRRISVAARQLCATPRSLLLPRAEGRAWRCRREAVASAVARLSTPELRLGHAAWLSADPDAEPQARVPGASPSSRKEEGAL